jgi:cell division septation protein DedD
MVKVAQHISQLLYCHDCVIVPTFGGFVTNYQSAQLNAEKGIALPPSKTLSFNRFLLHNDGLLINEISKQEGISYNESSHIVKEYANECQLTLDTKGRLELDKIGVLYFDDKKLKFKPSDENFAVSAFGFNPVVFSLKQTEENIKTEEITPSPKPISRKTEEPKENRTTITAPQPSKKPSKSLKYMSAALFVIVAFYSAWIPLKTDVIQTGSLEFTDLNPFEFNKCPSVYNEHLPKISFLEFEADILDDNQTLEIEDRTLFVKDITLDTLTNVAESTYVETVVSKPSSGKQYYVVAGCFQEESNAIKFVAALKQEGFQSEIIDVKNGLHRVAFRKFSSFEEALELHKNLLLEGKEAWVLTK